MADNCLKEDIMQTLVTRSIARLILAAVLLAGSMFLLLHHTKALAAAQTVVTIEFDDGNADQYQALAMLNAHGMHATFYVNTGFIGDSTHMSWSQLHDLFAAANEIGGHTLTHANLKHLKYADAHYQVCQDRDNLITNGFQPTSFAYPFGSFDSGTQQIVAACGYNSG